MTSLWLTLLVKSTLVLAAGAAVAAVLRSKPAAVRHLVWLSTLFTLLLLPLGWLIPEGAAPPVLYVQASIASSGAGRGASTGSPSLLWLWLAGAAMLLVRVAVSLWRSVRLVRRSDSAEGRVRITHELHGPVSWSFGKGAVLLPWHAQRWPKEAQDTTIRHELAHVARRDSEALLIGELACALYWFHPLVWYAMRRLRTEAEHAADDAVIAGGADPTEYASLLVSVARAGRGNPLLAGAGHPSTLAARIGAVLDTKRRRAVVTRRMWGAALAAVLAVALPLAATQTGERKIYKIGDGGITPPQMTTKIEPRYTPEAKDAKIQGTVKLSIIIEPDGRPSNIVVEKSLDPGLDANAMEAVGTWVFRPAKKDGEPVAVKATVEINFRLLD